MIYLGWNVKIALVFNKFLTDRNLSNVILTEKGYSVEQFGQYYAVRSHWFLIGIPWYRDLFSSGHSWAKSHRYFNDCTETKSRIESEFGKFIEDNV